jgi:signal transduction histidine kinase
MGTAGFQRACRDQEPRGRGEDFRGAGRRHLLQPQRTRHLSTTFPWWVISLAGAAFASGEWLRGPSRTAAIAALALLLLTAVAKRRGWLLAPLLLTAAVLAVQQWRIESLERDWPHAREARIEAAAARLRTELRDARLLADVLARRAAAQADGPREPSFHAIERIPRGTDLESGVVVFERSGVPRAWGGRFRLQPNPAGDSIGVRLTPFYAVLEVRRHAASGRTALGAVLLATHPAVPDPQRSLTARFRDRTEVGLRIWAPGEAPDDSDVFDYEQPTTGGSQVLFSVQVVPPDQVGALERARGLGTRRVAWALVLTLLAAIGLVPGGVVRSGLALILPALALRAPIGALFGIPQPFDPALFSSPVLGPLSTAAGPLAVAGLVLIVAGALLWEREPPRRILSIVPAALLLIGAPYLVSALGRGIAPPASGVSLGLSLVWHLALFAPAAGLVTLAAALLRGSAASGTGWRLPLLGAALAVIAAVIGVLVWNARFGWPDWYTLLWLPPLVLVSLPADRRAAIAGIALVAGGAAGLLTWGAGIEGRLEAARRDLAGLGDVPDAAAEASLREWGATVPREPVPASAPELYALWRAAPLSRSGRPATLGLWRSDGTPIFELELDALDLPDDLTASLVRGLTPTDRVTVRSLARAPATHQLLLVRLDSATVLSVALGPRSALVPRARLGRLLDPAPPRAPLYRLTLAPAPSTQSPNAGLALWRKEGWSALGQRTVTIAGVPRDVFGAIELGEPGTLAVRGALVVMLDTALLALLWTLAALLGGRAPRPPAWRPHLRSYQARVGAALSLFFLAPTTGFALWGLGRLRAEVREGRDRMIEQSLRVVAPSTAALPAADTALTGALTSLGDRADAALALYRDGGYLAGSTGGLLETLGILGPLMESDAYHRIVIHGDDAASAEGPSRAVQSRIGYRAVRLSDLGAGALAMPQVATDPVLADRQRDLALLFLLVTLAGVAASLLAARAAARAFARPVAELREAALAFGRGDPIAPRPEEPPAEFAPVFAAFEKMTEDVRKAREAQERVARIVAWGQMANQVAHEIKNPLTPMRLGIQHLRRVMQDRRTPIGPVLESTTARILSEIDRLDRIARSFSRFGTPASERGPLEAVDLPRVVREVADLYRLGPEGAEVLIESDTAIPGVARADEVKEALVNLLENSRNARAGKIWIRLRGTTIAVEDDGCGIPAELLPMIFEPRFSTSTSGSGLGLPIVKRLAEGWGGRVEVESEVGRGTVVRLFLNPASTLQS